MPEPRLEGQAVMKPRFLSNEYLFGGSAFSIKDKARVKRLNTS